MEIKNHFFEAVLAFCHDTGMADEMWRELEEYYTSPGRHYHTLDHLNSMLKELVPFQNQFSNWSTVVFAVAYHDAIYNPLRNNNEEKSAALAVARLQSIEVPEQLTAKCKQLILATKKHEASDYETNLFTDADLSILGSDSTTYNAYAKNVRQEYSMYPDFLYKPGRKKVLIHFLDMERIFKTDEFAGKFEAQARKNVNDELSKLL